jgi:hypothetical protein
MRRNVAFVAATSSEPHHTARPVTCLAFVVLLSVAFWAGAIWIAEFLIRVSQLGY